jgi:hypothetical protein
VGQGAPPAGEDVDMGGIVDKLLSPLRDVMGSFGKGVGAVMRGKANIDYVKDTPGRIKSEGQMYAGMAKGAAGQLAGEAKGLTGAKGKLQAGIGKGKAAAQGAAGKAKAAAQGGGAGKMGLFGGKPKCPACGKKVDPSWDRCPYCGAGEPEPAKAPSRTVAMSVEGGGGGTGMMGWLVPLDGAKQGELFTLKSGKTVIGTDPSCDIVVPDQFMSGKHCEIRAAGGQFVLADLGSTNGCFVNDKKIQSHELVDNDNVRLGHTSLKFKSIT